MRWTQAMMREVAREERDALGLGPFDPFDPYALCAEHGIEVYQLTRLRDSSCEAAVAHFAGSRNSAWSAALVPIGTARLIIENDTHAPVRRRSSISHELGHFFLEHEFAGVILGEDHSRQFDATQEKQASFLAGELLVPFQAVEQMAFRGWGNAEVAATFHVSERFAQMQMKGQRVRAQRAAARFGPKR